jgi:hypothetical protein
MLWPMWHNDIIWHKYVLITYIFKNKFRCWNFLLFFQWKHTTSFIHNCNLQTTTNEHKFFHFHFKKHTYKILTNYPTIIIKDFNINMLTNIIESIILKTYMNTDNFHITFIKNTTPDNTQINHIWTNAPTQQCHTRSTQTYWTCHNPIYFAFKLPKHIFQFIWCSLAIGNVNYVIDHSHYLKLLGVIS